MHYLKNIARNKALVLLVSLSLVLTAVLGVTIAQLVTQTPSLLNTFLPGKDPSGDLILRKEVVHPFGEEYRIPESIVFDFSVSLGEAMANCTLTTSEGNVTTDETGSFTVQLKAGHAIRIMDIAEGTAVTVSEMTKEGFTPNEGTTQECVIGKEDYQILFTNTYAPKPVPVPNIIVEGTKHLEGRDWQEGDVFTFLLEYKLAGSDQWTELGTAAAAYELIEVTDPDTGEIFLMPKPDYDKFSFTELVQSISYEKAGIYAFRVSEGDGTIAGITYDKVVSYFDILIGDAEMDGSLEIQSVDGYQNAAVSYDDQTDTFRVDISVNNQYAPEGTATATIRIHKSVRSYSGAESSAAGYTFELHDENGELVAKSPETSAAGESTIELTFAAKDAGKTYAYTLKETHAGENINGMEYDDSIYEILISVVDNLDGTISAYIYEASVSESEDPEDSETAPEEESQPEETTEPEKENGGIPEDATDDFSASFVNTYDPVDTKAEFSGTKVLEGRELEAGEFNFLLYAADASFEIPDGAKPERSAVNDAAGNFTFGAIYYDNVGVYRYIIKEDGAAPIPGITYDTALYYVTVTVTDEGGTLCASSVITNVLGEAKEITFTNVYRADPTGITLKGTKELSGMDLKADMFRFLLYEADSDYALQGNPIDAALNNEDGSFSFKRLVYSEAGTYYYVVTEDASQQQEGMTYDDCAYGIKIIVWDDGTGSLKAAIAIAKIGVAEVDEIRFINSYEEILEPTEPSAPTEPSEPSNPTEPSAPTDPSVPTDPVEPSEPTSPPGPGPSVPPTGDDTPVGWYIVMGCISFTGLVILLVLGFTGEKRTDTSAKPQKQHTTQETE